jgi:uncharacterized protein
LPRFYIGKSVLFYDKTPSLEMYCERYALDLPEIITDDLVEYIKSTYQLNWNGLHGWSHWMRVCEIGLRIARLNGADQNVVALFAFTHDMARLSDGHDHQHGPRAAKRIRAELQGRFFLLSDEALVQLTQAVALHTRGLLKADITVQTCWDSDRLDLGRAGITPVPHRLCTAEARDPALLDWAYKQSIAARRR